MRRRRLDIPNRIANRLARLQQMTLQKVTP
jgi:hypothetical protein